MPTHYKAPTPREDRGRSLSTLGSTIIFITIILIFIVACTGCQSHYTMARTTTSTDSTAIVQQHTLTHLTVTDTIVTREQQHLTLRDTTYTREHIIIRYDRETGQPIERTEDRDIRHLRTLDSIYQNMMAMQHTIDSLTTADLTTITTAHRDSTHHHKIKERGPQATPRQTVVALLFSLLLLAFLFYLIRKTPL